MSRAHSKLANPPIQEGLIDLRVAFEALPTDRAFESIAEEIASSYELTYPLNRVSSQFQITEDVVSTSSASFQRIGTRFQSNSSNFVFQAQIDGFTVSLLRPYSSWDKLYEETKRLWSIYEKHCKPINVGRIAVRYVNQFEAESLLVGLRTWLAVPPRAPDSMKGDTGSLFSRAVVEHEPTGTTTVLVQLAQSVPDGKVGITIDIDAFRVRNFDVQGKEWWSQLEDLRTLKNRVFFSSVTKNTLALFQ